MLITKNAFDSNKVVESFLIMGFVYLSKVTRCQMKVERLKFVLIKQLYVPNTVEKQKLKLIIKK